MSEEHLTDFCKVGDVITVKGTGVPRELETKFFRVLEVEDGRIQLSLPYDDEACTVRYHPKGV